MNKEALINKLAAESVELLKEMIAIPSPSFEEEDVCGHLCAWLEARGIAHERIGNNIIAEHIVHPEAKTLMMCAHIDTVSPSPEYSLDPYRPDYQRAAAAISESCGKECSPEDIVAGLGSNDDGASVVSMTAAYRYLTDPSFTADSKSHNLILVLT